MQQKCVEQLVMRKPSSKHILSISFWAELGFIFSATEALTFCIQFQNNIWKERGRQLSLNLPFSLHRVCVCQAVTKPTKSKSCPC